MSQHRIVVLGAGYAGTHVAGRLARRLHPEDVAITMVNAEPDFVERIRMHQLAVGQDLPDRPLTAVLPGMDVRQARVVGLEVDHRTVRLEDCDDIAYDTLVYALGSTATDLVPGVAEHAHHVASRPAAKRLRARLAEAVPPTRVLVVGGGLTGIEAATETAEARPDLDVGLVTGGGLGDQLGTKARRHLRRVCDRLGITVHERVAVERVEEDGVITGSGLIAADVVVWAAGFAVHPIAAASGLEVDRDGRVVVDRTMRSVSHPDIYAVGDAALAAGANGSTLRMSCASGIPAAWQAADALAARLTGGSVPDRTIKYSAQFISLGRRDGLIQMVTPDDRARPFALTGRLAARSKEAVCAATAWSISHPTLGLPVRRRRTVPQLRPVTAVRRKESPDDAALTAGPD